MSKTAAKCPAIMFDLETLSTRADGTIISIGAVKFDPYSDLMDNEGFYASVSVDSNTEAGRHISESTLIWWMGQSLEARAVFNEPKVVLGAALDSLAEWIDRPDYQVWSNGADFDIPMLAHAFTTHGLTPPWQFYNTNCFRTIKKLAFAKRAEKVENPLKHNALTDAATQARQLQEFFKTMKKEAA